MTNSKCPACGCQQFYVKDPADEFEVYEFECRQGAVCFDPETDTSGCPDVNDETEVFCNACAWHDRFEKIK